MFKTRDLLYLLVHVIIKPRSLRLLVKRIGDQVEELKTSKPSLPSADTKILSSSEQQKKNNKEIERLQKI